MFATPPKFTPPVRPPTVRVVGPPTVASIPPPTIAPPAKPITSTVTSMPLPTVSKPITPPVTIPVTPATPTVTPATPTVTPATPTVTPATPTVTPATPTVTPATPKSPASASTITTLVPPTKPLPKTLQEQGIPVPRPVDKDSKPGPTPEIDEVVVIATPALLTQTDNLLTIYSNSGHMVQYLPQGANTNSAITIPKSVNRSTIIVLADDGSVVDFQYLPATDLASAINNRVTGEKVAVTVTKGEYEVTGTIVELGYDAITIAKEGELIRINNYDRLTLTAGANYLRPRLQFSRGQSPVTVSYLLNSIAWTCSGTAIIDGQTMYLRLSGTIKNTTETDIVATVKLVAGDVQQQSQVVNENYPRAMLASAPPASRMKRDTVETALVEDYTSYEVGPQTIRGEAVVELGVWNIPVHKLYTHDTGSYDAVNYGYRFKAVDFVPACVVNVYTTGENRPIGSYMGSGRVDEAQQGDEVDLTLGGTTVVQCTSEVVVNDVEITDAQEATKYGLILRDRTWRLVTTQLTTTIRNVGDLPANLLIRHFIGDSKLVSIDCKEFKQRKNGYLEWLFQIPPGSKEEKFVCTVVTAQLM